MLKIRGENCGRQLKVVARHLAVNFKDALESVFFCVQFGSKLLSRGAFIWRIFRWALIEPVGDI